MAWEFGNETIWEFGNETIWEFGNETIWKFIKNSKLSIRNQTFIEKRNSHRSGSIGFTSFGIKPYCGKM